VSQCETCLAAQAPVPAMRINSPSISWTSLRAKRSIAKKNKSRKIRPLCRLGAWGDARAERRGLRSCRRNGGARSPDRPRKRGTARRKGLPASMLGAGKAEFPPLLPVGFHDMLLPALRVLCVGRFPLSSTRARLMSGIEAMCGSLSAALIPTSVWIDGSFMTQKIDPADVDLAVRFPYAALPNPGAEQQAVFARIARKQFAGCDSYFFVEYPDGHPQHALGDMMRAYWQRQFGFSRRDEFKGVAVIRTPFA